MVTSSVSTGRGSVTVVVWVVAVVVVVGGSVVGVVVVGMLPTTVGRLTVAAAMAHVPSVHSQGDTQVKLVT